VWFSAPLFHTAALNHTALPVFLKGGTNVLVGKFDPAQSFDLIAEHRITLVFGVPAMFQQIALSPRWPTADLSSLRILHCGGAPVPAPLIRTYQDRGLTFVQGFGMTEASPGVLLLRPDDSVRKAGSAGTPMFFTDVRVVAPDGADAAVGEPGEVVVRGPNVMAGYWQRPDETARTLDGGWLHSGDIATVDDEGYLTIVDRLKDMIISGGENIYPAEIEGVLYEHPAVAECAVVGVPDERWARSAGSWSCCATERRPPRRSSSASSTAGWPATRSRGRRWSSTRSPATRPGSCSATSSAIRPSVAAVPDRCVRIHILERLEYLR